MQILNCKDTVTAVTFLTESNWDLMKAMKAYQDKITLAQQFMQPTLPYVGKISS